MNKKHRNIVHITLDSVRADHCSCYGYKRKTTPFLDKLAESGLKFENAVAGSIATPQSMFCVFTGDYPPIREGIASDEWVLDWRKTISKRRTLPEILKNQGYLTYVFTANTLASNYLGFNKGFTSHHYYCDPHDLPSSKKSSQDWVKKFIIQPILKKLGIPQQIVLKNLLKGEVEYKASEMMYDDLIKATKKEPYYLWALLIDTHIPYLPPSNYSFTSVNPIQKRLLLYLTNKMLETPESISAKERRKLIDAYDGEIRHVDSFLGDLWENIKNTDPILIIHADHGDGFGEHGFYSHPFEYHYEELIKVPLIIYNTDMKGIVKNPSSLLQIAPTILDFLNIKNEFDVESLINRYRDYVIVSNRLFNDRRTTVRGREWKLIKNPETEDELYNIKKDPMELNNLIYEEEGIVRDFRKIIGDFERKQNQKENIRSKIEALKISGKI